jgi:hypothetical protein
MTYADRNHTAPLIAPPAMPHSKYHWNAPCQRTFLETLACTGSVTKAAKEAGKSPRAAYALRTRKEGKAFRMGWDAAVLLARDVLTDTLLDRAIYGNEELICRENDGQMMRVRYDNPLGMRMLSRLDTMTQRQPDNHSYQTNVQSIANNFGSYLDIIACDDPQDDVDTNAQPLENVMAQLQSLCEDQQDDSLAPPAYYGNDGLNCELSRICVVQTQDDDTSMDEKIVCTNQKNINSEKPDCQTLPYPNRAKRRANERIIKRAGLRATSR